MPRLMAARVQATDKPRRKAYYSTDFHLYETVNYIQKGERGHFICVEQVIPDHSSSVCSDYKLLG